MADFKAPEYAFLKVSKPGEYQWATFIDDRQPQFKVHRTVGHAHAAMTVRVQPYGRRYPQTVPVDMALYHLEGDQWEPQLELGRGSKITHFPWQKPPPPPEVQQRDRASGRMFSSFDAVIYAAERELSGGLRATVLKKLREARAEVLRIIQED